MIEGNWTEVVIIDEAASPAQRDALETILTGQRRRLVGAAGEVRLAPARDAVPADRVRGGAAHEARPHPGTARRVDHRDQGPRSRAAGDLREHLQPDPRVHAGAGARQHHLRRWRDPHRDNADARPALPLRVDRLLTRPTATSLVLAAAALAAAGAAWLWLAGEPWPSRTAPRGPRDRSGWRWRCGSR